MSDIIKGSNNFEGLYFKPNRGLKSYQTLRPEGTFILSKVKCYYNVNPV